MARMIRIGVVEPSVRGLAAQLGQACPRANATSGTSAQGDCLAGVVQQWIQANMLYLPDPPNNELIAVPSFTLKMAAGDCDDLTVLYCSLAGAAGLRAGFTTGTTNQFAVEPTHVLPIVFTSAGWMPAEVCTDQLSLGQWPPGFRLARFYEVAQ